MPQINLLIIILSQVLKASHTFNLLDARHAISVTERQRYILKVRNLARQVANCYFETRKQAVFPLADDTKLTKTKNRLRFKEEKKKIEK